jgi:HPt (histidine-containing phosphotransfer) domain-containing protein
MDVRMPEMDGLQATRAIRARGHRLAMMPIIAFTANAFPEDVKTCSEAGMNDFVVKPARKKALVEAILRVLPAPEADRLPEHSAPPLALSIPANLATALDREVFAELAREIGREAAFEIHAVFTAETEARLKLLRELAVDSDRTRIGREAHSLKSAAGTFGYRELASLAQRLERDTARLAASEYRVLLDSMDAAYACASAQELGSEGNRVPG